MASQGSKKPAGPSGDDQTFPQPRFPRNDAHRPVSVVSSRMTDIASEDEGEGKKPVVKTHRPKLSDARPETARTGTSSKGPWAGGARKGFPTGKRGSVTSQTAGSLGRSPSLTSRSHVPSLTSNAFFHPMSSQKLQAQRAGAARPPTTQSPPPPPPQPDINDNATDLDGSVIQDLASLHNHIAPVHHIIYSTDNDDTRRAPPSRGTEVTEQEPYDRITGTTSPTQGHYAPASLTDSVRPLHNNVDNAQPQLNLEDKNFTGLGSLPSPNKSQGTFSNFVLPGMDGHSGENRNTDGAEKLSSAATSPRLNPVDSRGKPKLKITPTPTQHPSKGKVYEYFEGNTVFFFGGRWQNTRQRPINVATGLFVVIPCVLFFIFEASWLWHNISPALPIIFAYLAYICFSSFIHASISDPGLTNVDSSSKPPPIPPLAGDGDLLRVDPPTNDWTLIKSAEPTAAAMEVPVKHCRTCNIWRPPRAHHCRLCDNCVETHDHHCVWLNNCVGKRNYRYFFTFVSSATLLSAYLIGTSLAQLIVYMKREDISFGKSMDHFRGTFALVIIGFLAFCYPAALMGYHIFLMSRGETTREFMNSHKFAKKERYRAFSQGSVWRNLLAVLCRPRSPTYYRFKTKYKYGDQRLGLHRDVRPRLDSRGLEMGTVPTGTGGFQGPVALREAANQG
ncbi:Palmitoyltransferase ERF2 [Cladobotryum mycophilum]|uniref:Palmitoyltransferase n=1 Tax=Cladobotryum mycophilum TaxID=491253 RepID=A0ABR0SH77_9HYPO